MKNNISTYSMNKSDLEKLSKSELIKLILKQNIKPVPAPRTKIRPIPAPRKSVAQMVQNYEQKIIDEYKPVPAPRTKRPVAAPRTKIPVAAPRMIKKTSSITKDYNTKNQQGFKGLCRIL